MGTSTNPCSAAGAVSTPWWHNDDEELHLAAATRRFPKQAGGKYISLDTIHRYRRLGVAVGGGRRLRLRCFRGSGNAWATTLGEIRRFQRALTEARGGDA